MTTGWTMLSGLFVLLLLTAASAALAALLRCEGGLLPLPLLGGCATVLVLFGFVGLLPVGLWVLLVLAVAAIAFGLYKAGPRAVGRAFTAPALLFFLLAGVALWLLFARLQPMFTQWDEFTFWGTACKMTKEANLLHPAAAGNLAARSYLPGLMLLSYLFQAGSGVFSEWAAMAACDILFFAAFAACASLPRRHWNLTVLVLAASVLLPFFCTAPAVGTASTIYRTVMGDVPLALVFGGAACLWFGAGDTLPGKIGAGMTLCLLTLIKDMGFAYALILVALFFFDSLATTQKLTLKRFFAKVGMAVALALPVLALFVGWSRYCLAASGIDRNAVGGGETVTYAGILIGGAKQLVGIGRTETFAALMKLMLAAFVHVKICLLGPGVVLLAGIAAVAAAAWWTAPAGAMRRRVLVATGWLAAAFVVFYIFHLFLYYYNFAEVEALQLKDYARYIGPYYQGWLLAELCLLAKSAAAGARPKAARAVVLCGLAGLLTVFCWRGIPVDAAWDNADSQYLLRQDVHTAARPMNEILTAEDSLVVLSQGDDATRWYYYNYELTATVVRGFGGNYYGGQTEADLASRWVSTFMNLVPDHNKYYYDYQVACTANGLADYLTEKGCTYLLVDRTDNYLVEEFSELFDTPLTLFDPPTLYKVETRNGKVCLTVAAVAERGMTG